MPDFCGILSATARQARLDLPDKQQLPNLSMASQNCSYDEGMLFCGQIYNQDDLEKILGSNYSSPAAVARALLDKLGTSQGLLKINGIFSLAYYKDNRLLLAKDHFGVSPLFCAQLGEEFIFSTRLGWLANYPGFKKQVDPAALSGFIKYGWVSAHHSIYQGITKIPPGHYVNKRPGIGAKVERYFDPVQEALDARAYAEANGPWADDDLLQEFRILLNQAINRRLSASPGQGLLLSGGMDSSLLACQLMPKRKINAYTIGFGEQDYNEANYAKQVAEHLRLEYHEQIIDGEKARDILPALVEVYEEPFSDQSQIPTYAAISLASPDQPLWLGDGGDELFMGYPRHLSYLKYALPSDPKTGQRNLGIYLRSPWRAFMYLALRQPADYMDRHIVNREHGALLLNPAKPDMGLGAYHHIFAMPSFSRQAQLFDILTYLPGNGVIKASRLAKNLGRNIVSPLLDIDLFRFAQVLPIHLLAQNDRGKLIMRKLLYNYYPEQWIDRPKSGFGAPVTKWLQHEFAPWMDELINEKDIKQQGFFNYQRIRHYRQRLGVRGSATSKLWAVLMFQTWAKREGII